MILNEIFGNYFTKMGKLTKRYSHTHIASHDSKIHKYKKYVSATSLDAI